MHQMMWILQNGSQGLPFMGSERFGSASTDLLPQTFSGISVLSSSLFPLPAPWSIVQLHYKSNYIAESVLISAAPISIPHFPWEQCMNPLKIPSQKGKTYILQCPLCNVEQRSNISNFPSYFTF